jgi:hypothetical protein
VELENGRIYEALPGPDNLIGRVDLEDGRVFETKFGPDEYLGRVESDGRLFKHRPMAGDLYLGRVSEMSSLAHGGAAFLLLLLPRIAEENAAEPGSEQA